MTVGWLTFDQDRSDQTGSARIRAHNLIKYESQFEVFQTGRHYDAIVFQKYYWHDFAQIFPGIKIMDICDPDWLQGATNVEIVRFLEHIDGVVANTQATADYIHKLTNKPVVVIPDRHDMAVMRQKKIHKGRAKRAIWFGYAHNAHVLKNYIPKLVEHGLKLTIMADKFVSIAGHRYSEFKDSETFTKWPSSLEEANLELLKADMALLPSSRRPQDQYKSNNKMTHAWAVGLPVAQWGDDVDILMAEEARIKDQDEHYEITRKDYDCKKSIEDYKEFLEEVKHAKD